MIYYLTALINGFFNSVNRMTNVRAGKLFGTANGALINYVEATVLSLLLMLVLKNGTAEAFEAELEAQGYGGCFLYYDQGYAEASEGIDAMVLNAGRLMLFSTVLFLTAGVLFAYL